MLRGRIARGILGGLLESRGVLRELINALVRLGLKG